MKYAYAYDKGGKLSSYFKVSGIPHAVLIGADGTVVWSGHPGSLDEASIQKAIVGALPKPMWEWPASTKAVRAALLKRSYKTALDEIAKLPESDGPETLKKAVEGIVTSRVQGMKDAFGKGDFLGAQNAANALTKDLNGLTEKADAEKVIADIEADKEAQRVLKGQQKVAKIRESELKKSKEVEKAKEDLQKISKEFVGTYAATEAEALLTDLRKRKQ